MHGHLIAKKRILAFKRSSTRVWECSFYIPFKNWTAWEENGEIEGDMWLRAWQCDRDDSIILCVSLKIIITDCSQNMQEVTSFSWTHSSALLTVFWVTNPFQLWVVHLLATRKTRLQKTTNWRHPEIIQRKQGKGGGGSLNYPLSYTSQSHGKTFNGKVS
jgi:hypothetical protein